ncbi:MAG: GNAT family N-acetyltransferase [Actinomycetota bacterium]|nr:GNAT family N-acetyltransferase [Actinomycetota bacterium]
MSFVADERNPPHPGDRAPLVLRAGAASCRVQPWTPQPGTAQMVLYHQAHLPSVSDLQRWLDRLRALGYERVRTSALTTGLGQRAEAAGFSVLQELVLLEHVRPSSAPEPTLPTHRLVGAQHARAAAIDHAAFGAAWGLDEGAIHDVCDATPRHRARAAGRPLAGYAITGRDGRQGFLQRLAVHPDSQRAGLGRALVLDSLHWLALWRVQRVLVNTPTDNAPALELYERVGFRRMPERLRVYERSLT